MIMENGEIKMLNNEIIMKNGIKVKSNGIIVIKDGSKMRMNEGEHIDMSGNLILRKDSIQNRKK